MPNHVRFHQKSREGCVGCKLRRVKCDETKPHCSRCTRRGEECTYPASATTRRRRRSPNQASPTPPVMPGDLPLAQTVASTLDQPETSQEEPKDAQPMPSSRRHYEGSHYSAKHLLDLRLMHHYSIFTTEFFTKAFPAAVTIGLKIEIPRLALEHEFLMDAVLLVSMVHLGCTDPLSLESLPIYLYRDQALRALRHAVADTTPQNSDAVRSASVLLATVSFATDRITRQPGLWTTNWLTLVLGQRTFRILASLQQQSFVWPVQTYMQSPSNLYGSFADVPAPGSIPIDIQRALSREENNGWKERETLYNAATDLGRLISVLNTPREESWLEKQFKAWAFDMIPPEFFELVRQERPPALVILAYYLAFLKYLPATWIYQDVAIHDIKIIQGILHPTWQEYIAVPEMAVQASDRAVSAQILLRSLPERE